MRGGRASSSAEGRADVVLRFATAPGACRSDRLDETVCYADLATLARDLVARREFRLVEHLGHELLAAFRQCIRADARLDLTVRKVAPPVEGLLGGVSFTIEEDMAS